MMKIEVDVLIPVHNAADTLEETVRSALYQIIPPVPAKTITEEEEEEDDYNYDWNININVCCYDDGSTDNSWDILSNLHYQQQQQPNSNLHKTEFENDGDSSARIRKIPSRLLIGKSQGRYDESGGRGAGYARNRASELSLQQRQRRQQQQHIKTREKKESEVVVAEEEEWFLCLLDSDDIMHPTRVFEQTRTMMKLNQQERRNTLLGCTIQRDPPDSTWHYTTWCNNLTDERLMLERYRECTILQPTWFLTRSRFEFLGGYIEAPSPHHHDNDDGGEDPKNSEKPRNNRQQQQQQQQQDTEEGNDSSTNNTSKILRLIHPTYDTPKTIRLAEDLRFFHAHLHSNGLLRLVRRHRRHCGGVGGGHSLPSTIISTNSSQKKDGDHPEPELDKDDDNDNEKPYLVTYRHRVDDRSQSFRTSRKLLLHLRALALERCVLEKDWVWPTDSFFVVWGAGRDGKDFVKALSNKNNRKRVYCFVDVDFKKIEQGFYVNQEMDLKIPIVHFSSLAKTQEERQRLLLVGGSGSASFGRIDKSKPGGVQQQQQQQQQQQPPPNPMKKQKTVNGNSPVLAAASPKVAATIDMSILPDLPVVVCVAMYRTNGALESNVKSIGRIEGKDLWHFS